MRASCPTPSRLLLLLCASTSLSACSMVGAPGAPGPEAGARPARSAAVSSEEAARITAGVVELALDAIGTPYEWGGTDANGFDCSGLIQWAYAQFGISLPRVSTEQIRTGSRVDLAPDALRPGDILGFSLDDPNKTSHVGLYVGDYEFIHSSSTGVRTSDITNPYWQEHLISARRVVP